MKKSVSTRLMYSFMTIIVIIIVGITAGISYLIADYFFKMKEHELADKGHEMAETIEYFIRVDDRDTLYRYVVAVDRLVGARIWLFDENYGLLAASYENRRKSSSSDESFNYFFDENSTMTNLESEDFSTCFKKRRAVRNSSTMKWRKPSITSLLYAGNTRSCGVSPRVTGMRYKGISGEAVRVIGFKVLRRGER